MADVVTSIRIDADTKSAIAEMSRMEAGMNVLSKRAVPALGGAFGALSSQAISMTTGFSGASGVLATMGQTMLTMSPILGGVAIAAAAVTAVVLKNKDAFSEANEVIRVNRDALQAVADANVELSTKAKELIAIRNKAIEQELLQIEIKIKLTEAGLREADMWDRLLAMVVSGGGIYAVAASQTNMVNASANEQTKILTELIAKWKELNTETGKIGGKKEDQGKFTGFGGDAGLTTTLEELDRQRTAQMSGMGAAGPMGTEQQQAALEALRNFGNQRWEIENQSALRIAEMDQLYRDMGLQKDQEYANAVVAINAKKDQQLAALNAKSFKLNLQFYEVAGSAFQRMIAGQMEGHGGFAAFFVQTVGEAVQATLKAYGALWAAEAAANAISNPVLAASKARAAAMAGVAVGIVGGLTDLAVSSITRQNEQAVAQSEAATGGSSRSSSSGRTLVSQGPITLYYNSTIVVHGSILDKGDFFSLWSEAHMNYLRTAVGDATERAR